MEAAIDLNELKLKPYDCSDAECLYNLTNKNRAFLRKWLNWLDNVQSIQDSLAFIQRCITHKLSCYFIMYNGNMIGTIGFVKIDKGWLKDTAEIGYWLDEDMQGKGIITWAVRSFISIVIEENTVGRLLLKAIPDNHGSIRVAEKCGFECVDDRKETVDMYGETRQLLVYKYLIRKV